MLFRQQVGVGLRTELATRPDPYLANLFQAQARPEQHAQLSTASQPPAHFDARRDGNLEHRQLLSFRDLLGRTVGARPGGAPRQAGHHEFVRSYDCANPGVAQMLEVVALFHAIE